MPTTPEARNPSSMPELLVLVDDNDMDLEFHQIVLRKAGVGLPARVFEDGRSFLAFLRQPDRPSACIVFLDINMPVMSGFDVLEQIRLERLDHPDMRIYLLSSSSNPVDLARAASEPLLSGYLTKPLTSAMLAQALDTTQPHDGTCL